MGKVIEFRNTSTNKITFEEFINEFNKLNATNDVFYKIYFGHDESPDPMVTKIECLGKQLYSTIDPGTSALYVEKEGKIINIPFVEQYTLNDDYCITTFDKDKFAEFFKQVKETDEIRVAFC